MSNKFDILTRSRADRMREAQEKQKKNQQQDSKKKQSTKSIKKATVTIDSGTKPMQKSISKAIVDFTTFGNTKLNSPWTLYYHSGPHDEWDEKSYTALNTIVGQPINTVDDYYNFVHCLDMINGSNVINFYLFRHDRHPRYEAESNARAISWTARANMENGLQKWQQLCDYTVAENALKNIDDVDINGTINGVSITYKQTHYIIRMTISDKKLNNTSLINQSIIDILRPSTIQWQPIMREKK